MQKIKFLFGVGQTVDRYFWMLDKLGHIFLGVGQTVDIYRWVLDKLGQVFAGVGQTETDLIRCWTNRRLIHSRVGQTVDRSVLGLDKHVVIKFIYCKQMSLSTTKYQNCSKFKFCIWPFQEPMSHQCR